MAHPLVNEDIYQNFVELQQLLLENSPNVPGLLTILEDFISGVIGATPDLRGNLESFQQNSNRTGLRPFCCYARAGVLPPLPMVWQSSMEKAFIQGETSSVFNAKILNVNRRALLGLCPNSMINDEIVDGYSKLIQRPDCLISTTRLFSWMVPDPIDCQFTREGLSKVRCALIPINFRLHWTFAQLTLEGEDEVVVKYYDSLPSSRGSYPAPFQSWLQKNFPQFKKAATSNNPKQPPGVDCGLFMLMGMRMIAFGAEHLSQDEADILIPDFRARVLAELLAGQLDPLPRNYDRFLEELEEGTPAAATPSQLGQGSGMKEDPILLDASISPFPAKDEGLHELIPTIENDSKESTPASSSVSIASSNENMRENLRILSVASLQSEEISLLGTSIGNTEARKYATGFASQEAVLKMLREGVIASRSRLQSGIFTHFQTKDPGADPQLASLWRTVVSRKAHPLITRYLRYKYALLFWRAMKELGGKRGPKSRNVREAMIKRLCIKDIQGDQKKAWNAAYLQARRASVWVALVEMLQDILGEQSCVALSGVLEASYAIEDMAAEAREVFLTTIKSRVSEPGSSIAPTLQAASTLYFMIINDTLPSHPLRIEGSADLPFMDAVSVEASRGSCQLLS